MDAGADRGRGKDPGPQTTDSRTARGRRGEALALAELSRLGYRILATNARTRGGEIDIVALDGRTLCIVEVRTRSQDRFGSAEESVDARKQRRIAAAARELLARERWPAHDAVRFDVVAIRMRAAGAQIRVLRGAFYAGGR
jgi:putative endonuclease